MMGLNKCHKLARNRSRSFSTERSATAPPVTPPVTGRGPGRKNLSYDLRSEDARYGSGA